ncbi:NADPH-dependent ferric siderophore reductase, contains FAD-binding and SIP domains [Rhodococcoides kyotonense]|uniref:NADPH-dependent ferric siderophore reductase, contains FAD-binding and SIP domains n=2 Tax=Rhodococcoides kyotonense TaxID=398843 RepID=A0A239KFJ2_9NOCA|nr:NADPH-dependent ferric siderophore reductase, contains FAD-binding and SIP domains [Rhodococcus kyotonensis]
MSVLRENAHDRELDDTVAQIDALERPVPSVLRFTARLTQGTENPNWLRPNTALRIQLGPEHDDVSRVYTVRSFDAASSSMVVDVVLHGGESPMMRWVHGLQIGDTFALTGPRPHFLVPESDAKAAIFADDTAIPALFAMLQQWPSGREAIGWVATDDAEAFAELPDVDGVELHLIGKNDSLAEQALRMESPAEHVVWGAGERDEMRAIRRFFRTTHGLGKDDVAVFGYWKKGVSTTVIDDSRRRSYQRILEAGGTLADIDDLEIGD